MRERTTPLLTVLALTLAALLVTPIVAVAASGLPATVSISPEVAGPGATVEVIGLDFPPGQSVDLQLTTTAGPVHLGTATAVDGGYFRQAVTLPADAPPGYWELRATGSDGSVAVHLFEADAAVPLAGAEGAAGTTPVSGGNSMRDIAVMLVFALLIAGVGGGAAYVYYQSRLGDRQPGMSDGADLIWSGASAQLDPESSATEAPAWTAVPSEPQAPPALGAHPR